MGKPGKVREGFFQGEQNQGALKGSKECGSHINSAVSYHKAAEENLHNHPHNRLEEEQYADSPPGRKHLGRGNEG